MLTSMGKNILYISIVLIVAILSFVIGRVSSINSAGATGNQIYKLPLPTPKVEKTVNKTFTFPVKDQTNKIISQITYTITSVDELDQIVVKGQPATAVQGKTFLVVNIKLVNSSNQSVVMNTRNYIRLSVNNSTDLIAPDIHNDPVEVEPTSTKITRIGFPINTSDKKLLLHVGELSGEKTVIPLNI